MGGRADKQDSHRKRKAMLTWLMLFGNRTLKVWLTGTLKVLEVAEERIYLNWKHLTVRHL